MALVSAGVQVTVVDESTYFPSVAGTVPYILIATASNKRSGVTSSVAKGTLAENANKLYLMTSQYDLLETYGNPIFTTNGAETNEYGLLAAYSALAISNRCYVQRVDVDLTSLVGSLSRPKGLPVDGKYYLDITNSRWGFNVWNGATSSFTYTKATVITNPANLDVNGVPIAGYGVAGEIAINGLDPTFPAYQKMRVTSTFASDSEIITKDLNNTWQLIGSKNWVACLPYSQSYPNSNIFTSVPGTLGATVNVSDASSLGPVNSLTDIVNGFQGSLNIEYTNSLGVGYTVDNVTGQYSVQWYNVPGGNPTSPFAPIPWFSIEWTPNIQSGVPYGYLNLTDPITGPFNTFNIALYQPSPSYQYPVWNLPTLANQGDVIGITNGFSSPTGSIWQNVSDQANGSLVVMKQYNAASDTFTTIPAPFYYNSALANYYYDPTAGGLNIPIGTLYTQYDAQDDLSYPSFPNPSILNRSPAVAPQRNPKHVIFRRYATGPTQVTGLVSSPTFSTACTFTVAASEPGNSAVVYGTGYATINAGANAQAFISAFSSIAPPNCSASLNSQNQLVITHNTGGSVYLIENNEGTDPGPVYPPHNAILSIANQAGWYEGNRGVYWKYAASKLDTNVDTSQFTPAYFEISNWNPVTTPNYGFMENGVVSDATLANDTIWYWNDPTQADIMIQNNGTWLGYRNVTNSVRGENLSLTDPNGPIFSTTAPLKQSTGASLVPGDLWINTGDLENYPKVYRWTVAPITASTSWQLIDVSTAPTSNGMIFADARWANSGNVNPAIGVIIPISTMLTSNYLDLDAPNPLLYPQGALLFNTRRSGYNVKQYKTNYFTSQNFPNQLPPAVTSTWLSISGNKTTGQAYMGRQAQRAVIVKALKSGIDNNIQAREEQNDMNLLAAPQYPELAVNLNALNVERGDTGFIIVDSPLRLSPDQVVNWATNNNGLGFSTNDGLTIGDPYAGAWYPSCATTDLSGKPVITCPSHMILRTILQSDRESYPWIASAGTQRGLVDNAVQIGYLDSKSNNFIPLQVNQALRDVLYTNRINPITVIPGSGIVNFGNRTLDSISSAIDRVNVARLVAFLRRRLAEVANQYLFEPNDAITRNSIKNAIDGLLIDLVAKRALYDYLVVCDLTNNTPFRIENNELWVDIAIEPVKAVEFIYIPVRIKNTGSIGSSAVA